MSEVNKQYEEHVRPAQKEFIDQCSYHNIPAIAVCAVPQPDGGAEYEIDMVSAADCGKDLEDDMIIKITNVINGFDVVETNKAMEYNMDDKK